jgi:hypothetical protein
MILFMTQRRSFLALGLLGLLGASAAVSSADTTRAVALAELQSSASINVSVGTILDFSALNAMVVSSDAPAVVQVTDGSHAKALSPGVANIYVTVSGCPAGAMPCNAMGVAYHITVSAAD